MSRSRCGFVGRIRLLIQRTKGYAQHTLPLLRQSIVGFDDAPAIFVRHGDGLVAGPDLAGEIEQHIHRALAKGDIGRIAPGRVGLVWFNCHAMHGRHALALGGEGRFGHARPAAVQVGLLHAELGRGNHQRALGGVADCAEAPISLLGRFQHGVVAERGGLEQQIQAAHVGLRLRVEDGIHHRNAVIEQAVILLPRAQNIQRGDGHTIFGEGARLVRADDGGRAEGLHRRQLADERAALEHTLGAQRQGDGHDRGQPFGHRGHGHADGGEKHETQFFAAQQPQTKDDGDNDQGGHGQPTSQLGKTTLQGRRLAFDRLQQVGDAAQARSAYPSR